MKGKRDIKKYIIVKREVKSKIGRILILRMIEDREGRGKRAAKGIRLEQKKEY
jgi:hypothetical protein